MKRRNDFQRPSAAQAGFLGLQDAGLNGRASLDGHWALLGERDADLVQRFYLSLSGAERQMRFRGDPSDAAIVRYCGSIDWTCTLVAAGGRLPGMRAAVQVCAASAAWAKATITLACAGGEGAARARMLADLVQLAVFAAGQRGCGRFAVRLDVLSWEVMPLLTDMNAGAFGVRLAQDMLDGRPQGTATAAVSPGFATA